MQDIQELIAAIDDVSPLLEFAENYNINLGHSKHVLVDRVQRLRTARDRVVTPNVVERARHIVDRIAADGAGILNAAEIDDMRNALDMAAGIDLERANINGRARKPDLAVL